MNLLLLGSFVAGVFYRLWFIGLIPQPFVYDQYQYLGFIYGILDHGFFADYSRTYGYPLLVAPVFALFGRQTDTWKLFHAILDTGTAFMIFYLAKELFNHSSHPQLYETSSLPSPARRRNLLPLLKGEGGGEVHWLCFLLCLFNPFTSAYVGVLLTETTAIFFLTLSFVLLYRFLYTKDWRFGYLLVFVSWYLVQIRPMFLGFAAGVLLLVLQKAVRSTRKNLDYFLRPVLLSVCFLVPFLYTLTGNLMRFQQFALMTVDNVFARELYTSFFVGKVLPDSPWPSEVHAAWNEFSLPTTPQGRTQMAREYLRKSAAIIRANPVAFIESRVRKMWYVWEKTYLFPYVAEKHPFVNGFVYWGNLFLLGMAGIGVYAVIGRARKYEEVLIFSRMSVFLFVCVSLSVIFSTAEERFSLPAYPLVFLYAGLGISILFQKIKERIF